MQLLEKVTVKFKTLFGLDYPKCEHRKLYRLPHDFLLCPECFRGFNFRIIKWDSIKLSNKELQELFEIQSQTGVEHE